MCCVLCYGSSPREPWKPATALFCNRYANYSRLYQLVRLCFIVSRLISLLLFISDLLRTFLSSTFTSLTSFTSVVTKQSLDSIRVISSDTPYHLLLSIALWTSSLRSPPLYQYLSLYLTRHRLRPFPFSAATHLGHHSFRASFLLGTARSGHRTTRASYISGIGKLVHCLTQALQPVGLKLSP